MAEFSAPNFGEILAPSLQSVPDDARPGLLARLERGAAERYREWAASEQDVAAELSACADREEQIAETVDALFPLAGEQLEGVEKAVPIARELYYKVFEGRSVVDQWRIQASAERQGAAAWRGIASQHDDESVRKALEGCAKLEEESAAALDRLIEARA